MELLEIIVSLLEVGFITLLSTLFIFIGLIKTSPSYDLVSNKREVIDLNLAKLTKEENDYTLELKREQKLLTGFNLIESNEKDIVIEYIERRYRNEGVNKLYAFIDRYIELGFRNVIVYVPSHILKKVA